jgi:hypothetical protein
MPLTVPRAELDRWLDPSPRHAEAFAPILQSASAVDSLIAHLVARL